MTGPTESMQRVWASLWIGLLGVSTGAVLVKLAGFQAPRWSESLLASPSYPIVKPLGRVAIGYFY